MGFGPVGGSPWPTSGGRSNWLHAGFLLNNFLTFQKIFNPWVFNPPWLCNSKIWFFSLFFFDLVVDLLLFCYNFFFKKITQKLPKFFPTRCPRVAGWSFLADPQSRAKNQSVTPLTQIIPPPGGVRHPQSNGMFLMLQLCSLPILKMFRETLNRKTGLTVTKSAKFSKNFAIFVPVEILFEIKDCSFRITLSRKCGADSKYLKIWNSKPCISDIFNFESLNYEKQKKIEKEKRQKNSGNERFLRASFRRFGTM